MSDAIKCDRCGEFEEVRYAPFDLDLEVERLTVGDKIVLPNEAEVAWPRKDETVDLCSGCAVEPIEWLDRYIEEADR
jgi:hypothetical protein